MRLCEFECQLQFECYRCQKNACYSYLVWKFLKEKSSLNLVVVVEVS